MESTSSQRGMQGIAPPDDVAELARESKRNAGRSTSLLKVNRREFRWPPLVRNRWPLTIDLTDPARLAGMSARAVVFSVTGPNRSVGAVDPMVESRSRDAIHAVRWLGR
jgi:hypothetical protein